MKKNKKLKQKIQKKHIKKRSNKLWSIPQPDVHSFEGRGYQNLYHFTYGDRLNDIFKYGIILGDVMVNRFDGFNSPNLTTEGRFHNPPHSNNSPKHSFLRGGVIRLTVNCPKDPKKLINYGWFDTVYCNGISKISNVRISKDGGDLDHQYIYLGHIEPSMIGGVNLWNRNSKSWERLRKHEIDSLCKEFEELPYKHKLPSSPNQLRISGLQLDDYTGMLKQYYSENDNKDIYRCFYKISDVLCNSFKHSPMRIKIPFLSYRMFILSWFKEIYEKGGIQLSEIIEMLNYLIKLYNTIIPESEELDPNPIIEEFCYEFLEWEKWLNLIHEETTEEYEEQLKLVS